MPKYWGGETEGEKDRRTMSVHLQGIGRCHAKPAGDFRVGEKMCWNYGHNTTIQKIERSPTGKMLIFTLMPDTDLSGYKPYTGKPHQRRMKPDRLVAIG